MHRVSQPPPTFFSLPKKMYWMALLSGLLGIVIAICAVHVVIIKHEREFLLEYSKAILSRAVKANTESRLSLEFANKSQFIQCSPQDIEYLQLQDEVLKVLQANAKALGSGYELSERLRRIMCEYCGVANPAGKPSCIACGAPLGRVQPSSCKNCGYIILHNEKYCPNCKNPL